MRTFDQLENLWQQSAELGRVRGAVRLICARTGGGNHDTPEQAELSVERGLHGDRWEAEDDRELDAQITLMNHRVAELIADGAPLHAPGDNFLVDLDLSETAAPVGTRIRLGDALVEVTPEPHMGCRKFSARFGQDALRWVNWKDHRERRLRGVNCRVVEPGAVAVGAAAVVEHRPDESA